MSCFSLGKGLLSNMYMTCADVLWGPVVQRRAAFGRELWQVVLFLSFEMKLKFWDPREGQVMVLHQVAFCCNLGLRAVSCFGGGKHQLLEFRCGSLGVVGAAASPQCSFCTNPAPSSGLFPVVFEVCLQHTPSCWPLARVMTDGRGEGCLKKGLPVAWSLPHWLALVVPPESLLIWSCCC